MKQILTGLIIALYFSCHLQAQSLHIQLQDATDGKSLSDVFLQGYPSALLHISREGFIRLPAEDKDQYWIVRHTGFSPDTVYRGAADTIIASLRPAGLNEVIVESNGRKNQSMQQIELISSGDLVKDACCNLSETFENTTTVDVHYNDAITGAKEIRMLGLDGVYAAVTSENIPSIRGLAQSFGMIYVPGPWMSSIQITKGTGSVVNGFESITGQINVEYKKPQRAEKWFVNYFLNQDVRNELNVQYADTLNHRTSTLSALHGQLNLLRMDMNHDRYMDNPQIANLNVLHRWSYLSGKGFNLIAAAEYHIENRQGGQMNFRPGGEGFMPPVWGMNLNTHRVEAFAKTGFILNERSSLGIQYKYTFHRQTGNIGTKKLDGREHTGYINAIYQDEFLPKNTFKTGLSLLTDNWHDQVDSFRFALNEVIPGVFSELNLNYKDKWMTTIGIRTDFHNRFGAYVTPRLHMQWKIIPDLSLRVSAGRGFRTPMVFAENLGLLASARKMTIETPLQPEKAWNAGASLSYTFYLDFREGHISVDYYFTHFEQQWIWDLETSDRLRFYSVQNQSRAHATQIEIGYEIFRNFQLKLAYKFEDNRVRYRDGIKIVPLKPRHRGLVSMEYQTPKKRWRFNTSLNWFGKTRVPDAAHQAGYTSPDWFQWNAQITYTIKKWEIYIGGENLVNFYQPHPIMAGDQPFSEHFDASLIWGPLRGAMAFTGFRWRF